MKLKVVPLIAILLVGSRALAEPAPALSEKDKTSYALGVNLAGNLKQQGIPVDLEQVVQGMKDAYSGKKLLFSDEEVRKYIAIYQNQVRNSQAQSRTVAAEANRKAGEAFLADNARKKGVVTLPSGLQYKVLRQGQGVKPAGSDTVEFTYRLRSINGTEVESSFRSGKPAVAKIKGGMIPGLTEAFRLMPAGSKWELFIPSRLAYGVRGNGTSVGPDETVVFEIELLSVKGKEQEGTKEIPQGKEGGSAK